MDSSIVHNNIWYGFLTVIPLIGSSVLVLAQLIRVEVQDLRSRIQNKRNDVQSNRVYVHSILYHQKKIASLKGKKKKA